MHLAFMGTADFAVPSLEALVGSSHEVLGVWTQPDRPAGRGRKLRSSPVKQAAQSLGLEVYQHDSLQSDDVRRVFSEMDPALVVVVAYGQIIPGWLRELGEHGALNLHGSLLPRYRGAAPVNWAIARGETRTGVCTMRIDAGLDTGPVYACRSTEIGPDESAPSLSMRLSQLGASLLLETIDAISEGRAVARHQDETLVSLAPRLRREDGYIRWEEEARSIHNKVRGFDPWPSVSVRFRDRPCRILTTTLGGDSLEGVAAGTIVFDGRSLSVCCGDAMMLRVSRIQMENRKAVSGAAFGNGMRLEEGERFTEM